MEEALRAFAVTVEVDGAKAVRKVASWQLSWGICMVRRVGG